MVRVRVRVSPNPNNPNPNPNPNQAALDRLWESTNERCGQLLYCGMLRFGGLWVKIGQY